MALAMMLYVSLFCFILCGPIQEVTTEANDVYIDSKLRCDTCQAIAYQLKLILDKEAQKTPGVKLNELDSIEAVGKVCKHEFMEYEVTNRKGRDHLVGPGVTGTKQDDSEVTRDQWLDSLHEMCQKFIGDVGELRMYNAYYKDPSGLKDFLCNGEGVRGICLQTAREESMFPEGLMFPFGFYGGNYEHHADDDLR